MHKNMWIHHISCVQHHRCDNYTWLCVHCVWGCRASSEWLRQLPSWRSWKRPWTVVCWMCWSTPPTHTPSQVNNTHTHALFKAHFHNNNPYTVIVSPENCGKKTTTTKNWLYCKVFLFMLYIGNYLYSSMMAKGHMHCSSTNKFSDWTWLEENVVLYQYSIEQSSSARPSVLFSWRLSVLILMCVSYISIKSLLSDMNLAAAASCKGLLEGSGHMGHGQ